MSREDDVKTLSAGLHEFSTGNEWETLGVAAAIAAFVDARIREAMKPSEVAPLEHRPECASWNMSHAGGMQMAATPCNCDLYKRMVAPVQPEATAAKTWRCTMCGGDHPTGKSHTETVALQAQGERLQQSLEKATGAMLEAAGVTNPAAVGPKRVTLYIDENGDWWKFQTSDPIIPKMPSVAYVRASAHNRAVELLRSAVERWPSYNVRDDVVAFLRAHDVPPPRHPADKHGDCTQCGGASHDGAC